MPDTALQTPFIASVRKLYEDSLGLESPFHLSPCGQCGGPSFQQPCPLCGYYPMGIFAKKTDKPTISCAGFERAIDRSGVGRKDGNVATWLAREQMRTVAYIEKQSYRNKVDAMLVAAQSLEGLPSAAEIYDLVAVRGKSLSAARHRLEPDESPSASPTR
jgi:hypothetical protein